MIKDNPLFQDSSISTGTNIRTQFEVSKVCLHDGESLSLILSYGPENKILSMKCLDFKTGTYACSHWLKHRQEISYQFIISNNEDVVFKSPIKKGLAMYTVLEVWQAVEEGETEEEAPLLSDFVPQDFESTVENHESEGSEEESEPEDVIGNLIDKWGL